MRITSPCSILVNTGLSTDCSMQAGGLPVVDRGFTKGEARADPAGDCQEDDVAPASVVLGGGK